MIQDLFHSDNVKVNAALDALVLNFDRKQKKSDKIQAVRGWLDKTIDRIPACDRVTKLNVLAELTSLHNTLRVIVCLSFQHAESGIGIPAIGGVEAAVKVMKTFLKCQMLQGNACVTLRNLACSSFGKANTIDSGGIEVLLDAINNRFLGSTILRKSAFWALRNIVKGSKENVGLLITFGAALAIVRTKRPYNNEFQTDVRWMANLIASEMKAWPLGLMESERRK
jgi:hypothetical protein